MNGMDFSLLATLLAVAFLTAAFALYVLNVLSRREAARHASQTTSIETGPLDPSPEQAAAQRRELVQLRATVEHVPLLMWRQDRDGALTWANKPYIDLTETVFPDRAGSWPMPHLFKQKSPPPTHVSQNFSGALMSEASTSNISIKRRGKQNYKYLLLKITEITQLSQTQD